MTHLLVPSLLLIVLVLAGCGRGEDPARGAKDDLRSLRDELARRSIVINTELGGQR